MCVCVCVRERERERERARVIGCVFQERKLDQKETRTLSCGAWGLVGNHWGRVR